MILWGEESVCGRKGIVESFKSTDTNQDVKTIRREAGMEKTAETRINQVLRPASITHCPVIFTIFRLA